MSVLDPVRWIKTRLAGNDARSGTVDFADSSCATACCKREFAFPADNGGINWGPIGNIRYPRNSVDSRRTDSGKTVPSFDHRSCRPRHGHKLDKALLALQP